MSARAGLANPSEDGRRLAVRRHHWSDVVRYRYLTLYFATRARSSTPSTSTPCLPTSVEWPRECACLLRCVVLAGMGSRPLRVHCSSSPIDQPLRRRHHHRIRSSSDMTRRRTLASRRWPSPSRLRKVREQRSRVLATIQQENTATTADGTPQSAPSSPLLRAATTP